MRTRTAKLYKIQEIAKKTKLTERTLRFYESEGLLNVYHTPGGMRLYTPQNLEQIKNIKKWVAEHKIAEVKKMIPAEVKTKPVLFVDPTVSPDFEEFENDFIKVLKIPGNPIDYEFIQNQAWQLIEQGCRQFYALHTSAALSKNFNEFSEWVKEARDFHFQTINSHKMGLAFLPWLESLKTKNELNFDSLKNYEEYFYIPKLNLAGAMSISFEFSPLITFDQTMKVVDRDLAWSGFQNWLKTAELAGKKIEVFINDQKYRSGLSKYPTHKLSAIHEAHLGEQAIGIVQYS